MEVGSGDTNFNNINLRTIDCNRMMVSPFTKKLMRIKNPGRCCFGGSLAAPGLVLIALKLVTARSRKSERHRGG